MNIKNVLNSGDVIRFHAVPGMTKQTVSEHAWGVATLCQYFDPDCSKNLILAAMFHDAAELVTGDIPSTAKWEIPNVAAGIARYEGYIEEKWGIDFQLLAHEKQLLKICDSLDGMRYCLNRRLAGERSPVKVFWKWADSLADGVLMNTKQSEFYFMLIAKMEEIEDGSK